MASALSPASSDRTAATTHERRWREQCDNGFNDDTYSYSTQNGVPYANATECGDGCMKLPYCGDGLPNVNEQCDNGSANNSDTAYNGCKKNCTYGPYCGDGIQDTAETCDNGPANTAYGSGKCGYDCKPAPFCGDGVRNGSEQCDDPKGNDGSYGGCKSTCKRAPYCGDGKVAAGKEDCDDGPTGSLTCSSTCEARSDVK